jgi:hypothetical protein
VRRSIFRHMLLGAALTAPFLLAGCGGDEGVPQNFPPLRYNYLAPISLNVASIQTQVNYAPIQDGTGLDSMSPETPLQAVQQMIQDRLVAGGAGGTAVITINSASINRVTDTAVGNISLRLTVTSADGRMRSYTDASVSRTRTLPDDTSDAALHAFLYSMTQDLVNAENVELEYQIRQHLPQWIVGGGSAVIGGPAAPTPVQAVPLSSPGAPVMGTVPLAAPQPLGNTAPETSMPSMPGMTMPSAVPATSPQPDDTMPGGDLGMPQGNPVPSDQDLSTPATPGAPTPLTPAAPATTSGSPAYQLVPVQPNGTTATPAGTTTTTTTTTTPAARSTTTNSSSSSSGGSSSGSSSSGTLPPLPPTITP